jgi:tetratricopeptide (TPR) repeat protein
VDDLAEVLEQAALDLRAGRYEAAAAGYEIVLQGLPLRTSALYGLALASYRLARYERALWCYKALLDSAPQEDWQPLLHQLGMTARGAGCLSEAQHYFQEERRLLADSQTTLLAANSYERGWLAALQGNYQDAENYLKGSWQYGAAAGDLQVQACALRGLGDVAALQGNKLVARQYFRVSQKIFIKAGAVASALEVTRRLGALVMVE